MRMQIADCRLQAAAFTPLSCMHMYSIIILTKPPFIITMCVFVQQYVYLASSLHHIIISYLSQSQFNLSSWSIYFLNSWFVIERPVIYYNYKIKWPCLVKLLTVKIIVWLSVFSHRNWRLLQLFECKHSSFMFVLFICYLFHNYIIYLFVIYCKIW